jgi:hypothetical protein
MASSTTNNLPFHLTMLLSKNALVLLFVAIALVNVAIAGITFTTGGFKPSYTLFDHHIYVKGDVNDYSIHALPYSTGPIKDSKAQCNALVKNDGKTTSMFTAPCQTSSKQHDQLFKVSCLHKHGQYVKIAFLKNGTSYIDVVGNDVYAALVIQPYSQSKVPLFWLVSKDCRMLKKNVELTHLPLHSRTVITKPNTKAWAST